MRTDDLRTPLKAENAQEMARLVCFATTIYYKYPQELDWIEQMSAY